MPLRASGPRFDDDGALPARDYVVRMIITLQGA
jgi:hypothetical protein